MRQQGHLGFDFCLRDRFFLRAIWLRASFRLGQRRFQRAF